MKIAITCPGFSVHGGIRIILEWANRLCRDYGHQVSVYNTAGTTARPVWFNLNPAIPIECTPTALLKCEVLIITSPHGIELENHAYMRRKKVFIFLQMMEHLFRPTDNKWLRLCMKFYKSKNPMILGAKWNHEWCTTLGRTAETYYVGNGVNTDDFPITRTDALKKNAKTILVEGWECTNPAKDTQNIAPKVASKLKLDGFRIIAYSQKPLTTYPAIPDEYHEKPNLATMNRLYSEATVLLKATRYDARALAPMEAMTKGTPTIRAIVQGDDDLMHGYNCVRVPYDEDMLHVAAISVLKNEPYWRKLSANCIKHVTHNSWDKWMLRINNILINHEEKEISLIQEPWTERCSL